MEESKSLFEELDKWLRRHTRACIWKSLPSIRIRNLKQLGVRLEEAISHGYLHKSINLGLEVSYSPDAVIDWLF
jgi:RNA-directed DNA polymerase